MLESETLLNRRVKDTYPVWYEKKKYLTSTHAYIHIYMRVHLETRAIERARPAGKLPWPSRNRERERERER